MQNFVKEDRKRKGAENVRTRKRGSGKYWLIRGNFHKQQNK